jgi:hypothetical protein
MAGSLQWRITTLPGRPTVLEISVSGYISVADLQGEYGITLNQHLAAGRGPLAVLFIASRLHGMELSLPTAHASMMLPHMQRVQAVATVSSSAFVRFGMASASLVMSRKFRTFDSREEALAWLFGAATEVQRGK